MPCYPAWPRGSARASCGANEGGGAAAIKRGSRLGRRPSLDHHQQQEAIARRKAGESCRAIAKTYRVHHATIARLAGGYLFLKANSGAHEIVRRLLGRRSIATR